MRNPKTVNVALVAALCGLPLSFAHAGDASTPAGYAKATKLIGAELKDADGKKHAEIVDLLLGPTHDQVRYALVRCEKDADRDFLIPLSAIRFEKNREGECTLNVQPEVIMAGQAVKHGDSAEAQRVAAAEHANIDGVSKICPASKAIGAGVVDSSGEKLGSIDDLLVNTTNGAIPFAIVATGGVLGIGEKTHAMPPAAFRDGSKDGKERVLAINTTKELLKDAPTCDKGSCPDPTDVALLSRLNEIYGVTPSGHDTNLVHTTEIVDSDVRLRGSSDKVGEVKDVSFDLGDGRLAFVVLELDKLPGGIEDCNVAVPWQYVSYDPTSDSLTVNVEAQKFTGKECRVEHGVASLTDGATCDRITRFFGGEPETRTTADAHAPVCGKEFIKRDVNDTTGKGVGAIKDIAVDRATGKLRYVAVLLNQDSDKLGNEKLVALHWNELKVSNDQKPVTLLVDAPRINADRVLKRDPTRGERRDG